MEQILFFSVLILFLCAVSGFTALGVIIGLGATMLVKRIIIGVALSTPILFILANVWFRYAPNIFSQIFYIVTSYLGGVFLYWFFASVIICLLFILSYFIKLPLVKISFSLYMLASIVGVTGIVQAFFTRTVTYTLTAPLQYPELKGKRIALIADTHFGPVNQASFAKHVVEKVLETNPDAVLLAGDMFDGPAFDTVGVEKELQVLTEKIPVFFTPGNHEEYGAFNEFLASARRGGMTVLVDEKSEIFGVPVFGLNYRSKKDPQEVENLLLEKGITKATPAIVINHEPSFQTELQNAGVFLNTSGHTHGGQLWPGIFIARRVYKEYVYGLVTKSSFNSITTNGIGTAGPRMRTFNRGEVVVIEFR
ncbi:MAG: metallophosphoesterase [Candidatus Zambryskibacteria bacterium]|nr:metallophosphoesterase [Candidatus Zambryskibacteria bacterium]